MLQFDAVTVYCMAVDYAFRYGRRHLHWKTYRLVCQRWCSVSSDMVGHAPELSDLMLLRYYTTALFNCLVCSTNNSCSIVIVVVVIVVVLLLVGAAAAVDNFWHNGHLKKFFSNVLQSLRVLGLGFFES